eukprot:113626_1
MRAIKCLIKTHLDYKAEVQRPEDLDIVEEEEELVYRGGNCRGYRGKGRGSMRGTSCCNRVGKGWRGDTLKCDKCERIWMPSEEYRRSYRGTQRGGNRGRNRGGNRGVYRGGNCR